MVSIFRQLLKLSVTLEILISDCVNFCAAGFRSRTALAAENLFLRKQLALFQEREKKAAPTRSLLSDEHFTVDGTLIEAWAGQKSFQPKGSDHNPLNPPPPDRSGNPTVNWHKEKRSNETPESLTDPMARLYKKSRGAEARLGYLGHVLTENRNWPGDGYAIDAG